MQLKTCRICLVEHDEEIHAATVDVHEWFHQQVTLGFYEESAPADDEQELQELMAETG